MEKSSSGRNETNQKLFDSYCKRILKNEVYLGHTQLGKSRKVSVKSKVKAPVEKENWSITKNTHEAIVSETIFEKASLNMLEIAL